MALEYSRPISFEEYTKLREQSDERLEYIDGVICMQPSPSIKHQLVSSNLHTEFVIYQVRKKYSAEIGETISEGGTEITLNEFFTDNDRIVLNLEINQNNESLSFQFSIAEGAIIHKGEKEI